MMAREECLDVSDLEPPDPMMRTLDAAERLQPGCYLRMTHRREPCMLYDRLEDRGFAYDTRSADNGQCLVFIWRSDDPEAGEAAQSSAAQHELW